ncbi:MAG: hypothetical protein ACK5CA_13615 [Cyanobacteriota bacterium]|jgi:hypothetical protein
MQTKRLLLLTALTVGASLSTLSLAPSAEAISYRIYNVNASFSGDGGGAVTGSFYYSLENSALFNPSLTITSSGGLYNGMVSNILSASPGSLIVDNNPTNGPDTDVNYRLVQLFFVPDLDGSPEQTVSITTTNINASYVWRNTGTGQEGFPLSGSAQAQPVPLESDALPVISAVGLISAGFWFKLRRAKA